MDELIQDFTAECREMLQALGGEIVAWEAMPQDKARLDEIFRFVHTVKGNCGFLDLPRIEALAHAAEDVLADVRAGRRAADSRLVSAVLAIIDRISVLVEALDAGESVELEDEPLIRGLSEVIEVHAVEQAAANGTVAAPEKKSLRSIRLSVELLDQMMSNVSDMVLARNELARRLREAPGDVAVETAFERVSACIAEMRDAITRTRMQRIESLFLSLPRLVRDLTIELGKQASLETDGGDVELDREMIEMIRDPLTHIVRNAIDHGIEMPADRLRAGKPPAGNLRVSARQSGNQILIEVADDGRGIDSSRLVDKAVDAGLLTRERAERLSEAQRLALVFEAGLSTASQVTAISGRGVGMDVVRANIERIGGVVDIDSKPGKGLRLTLRVPLTLTIIPALTVSIAGESYAIPRTAIEEIVRLRGTQVSIERVGGSRIANIRDKRIPLVSASDVLGGTARASEHEQTIIVLKPAGADLYALAVDAVHDHEELVVKPAAPLVMATGLYAGTTLADDGKPILLLDPSGLSAAAGVNFIDTAADLATEDEAAEEQIQVLLFRSLEGQRRAVRLAIVERIEEVPVAAIGMSGGRMRVTMGERILPLAGCTEAPAREKVRILRLSDGESELAYAIDEIADIVGIGAAINPVLIPGEVMGVTLVAGEQVEVIDPHWLFGMHGENAADNKVRPVCALPEGDAWMDNILRPIIEGAGYRVVRVGDMQPEDVDVMLLGAEIEALPTVGGRVLRLRARPEIEHEQDDSIYRYDRAGLLTALSRVAGAVR